MAGCSFKPGEKCDNSGTLNLRVGSAIYYVPASLVGSIGFWNGMQPKSILEPSRLNEPLYCRPAGFARSPVDVRDFAIRVEGPNGLFLRILSPDNLRPDLVPRWQPIASAQIKEITFGEAVRGPNNYRLPVTFVLQNGQIRTHLIACILVGDTEQHLIETALTNCRIQLPLTDGNIIAFWRFGAGSDKPEQISRDIINGLHFAEELQASSKRALAGGKWP